MTTTQSFSCIDELLGPSESRFFGEGYRRVHHRLYQGRLTPLEGSQHLLEAKCAIVYPADWSSKERGCELRPHLSTVDAFVIAAQLVEALALVGLGMSAQQLPQGWFKKVVMKAGAVPQEDLDGFSVSCRCVDSSDRIGRPSWRVSNFVAQIGTIEVRVELWHPAAATSPLEQVWDDWEALLGNAELRYFGRGYLKFDRSITEIDLNLRQQLIEALIEARCPGVNGAVVTGLEADYHPQVTMLDCIISLAQLVQGLMYHLDGFERGQSNTLWMREICMECDTPFRSSLPFKTMTQVERTRILPVRGSIWRTINMVGEFQGIRSKYSLAHQLPESVGRLP